MEKESVEGKEKIEKEERENEKQEIIVERVEKENIKEDVEDKKKTRDESVREEVEKVRNDEKEFGEKKKNEKRGKLEDNSILMDMDSCQPWEESMLCIELKELANARHLRAYREERVNGAKGLVPVSVMSYFWWGCESKGGKGIRWRTWGYGVLEDSRDKVAYVRETQDLLWNGLRCRIGDGQTVRVWGDPWLRDDQNSYIETPEFVQLENPCEWVGEMGNVMSVKMFENHALVMNCNWRQLNSKAAPRQFRISSPSMGWCPPLAEFYNVNIDIAMDYDNCNMGFGWIVRDATRVVLNVVRFTISGRFSEYFWWGCESPRPVGLWPAPPRQPVLTALAIGAREALSWIKQMGWQKEIKMVLCQLPQVRFVFVPLSRNGPTHVLARNALCNYGKEGWNALSLFLRFFQLLSPRWPPLLEQRSPPVESYCSVAFSCRWKKPRLRWNEREVEEGARMIKEERDGVGKERGRPVTCSLADDCCCYRLSRLP
nr:ribonuclease H [Ipomoea batatas]